MPVTLTDAQLATLKADFASGPLAAQVGPLLHAKPLEIAAIYNARGSEMILIPSLSRDDFLLGVLPAIGSLVTATSAVQAKWNIYLDIAKSVDSVNLSAPSIQGLLAQLASDGLMTQAAVDAFTKRPCSRAETLFGAGVALHSDDVQKASEL